MSNDPSMNRIRTIRRRKDTAEGEAEDKAEDKALETTPTLPNASATPKAVEPPVAAAPTQPKPKPKSKSKPPPPRLDASALKKEIDALGPDAMAKLMSGAAPVEPAVGDQVQGTIVSITEHSVFVDIGAKSEAAMDRGGFDDPDAPAVGDPITAYVVRADGSGLMLATRLTGANAREMLAEAYAAGIPVEGKVASRNPGGFTISLGSLNAFCPVSQIARFPKSDLDSYIGKTLSFRIQEFKERDVVVSRKAIEEEEVAVEAATTWSELKVGDERDGVVAGHQEFGIFVDIGGVQGLVHKSELGWGDENPPPDVGTTVKVQVKSIDPERQRISLTMKDPAHGPWSRVGTEFLVGGSYTGTVTQIADFGAFVKLSHGLEGLVHISQMAEHRIDHPKSVVRKDQEVTVRILEVDREQGRISLSMRKDAGDGTAWQEHKTRKKQKQTFGTLGDLLSGLKLD